MPQCIDQPLLCRIWPLLGSSDSEVTNCEHSCVHYCASLSYFAYYKDCAHGNSTTRSHCSFCQRFSVNIEYLFGVVSFRLCFFSVLPKSHLRFVHLEPGIKTACLTHLPSVKFSLHKIAQLKVMQFFFRLALAKKVYLPRMKLVTQWVLFPKYVWN